MLEFRQVSNSIIKTLSYSDIFEFPLSKAEIYKYYIGGKVSRKFIYSVIDDLVEEKKITKKKSYYFLNGRSINYSRRITRSRESKRKMKIAQNYAHVLGFIPTIKLIGISGSLSMRNCDKRDDIDLFFITSKNTLWLSRFLVSVFLILKGVKRSRTDNFGIDRICPNMFLSEENLSIDKNIFTAHEIAQVKILVNKNNIYSKLLNKNSWVLKFMPNAIRIRTYYSNDNSPILSPIFMILDKLFYNLQYSYMKKRITVENVSKDRAAFHPKDKTNFVLDLYRNKYKSYKKTVFIVKTTQPHNALPLASNYTPGY